MSVPRFGFKSPLQAAKIPNLDAISSAGVNGLMDPVKVGLGCGGDTAPFPIWVTIRESITGVEAHSSLWALDWQCLLVTLHLSLILQPWMRKPELLLVGELTGTVKKVLYSVQHLME